MKIRSFEASNFLTFKEFKIKLSDLTTIVGPNASGKTNVLRAVEYAARLLMDDKGVVSIAEKYSADKSAFELRFGIEFSENEKGQIVNFIDLYLQKELQSRLASLGNIKDKIDTVVNKKPVVDVDNAAELTIRWNGVPYQAPEITFRVAFDGVSAYVSARNTEVLAVNPEGKAIPSQKLFDAVTDRIQEDNSQQYSVGQILAERLKQGTNIMLDPLDTVFLNSPVPPAQEFLRFLVTRQYNGNLVGIYTLLTLIFSSSIAVLKNLRSPIPEKVEMKELDHTPTKDALYLGSLLYDGNEAIRVLARLYFSEDVREISRFKKIEEKLTKLSTGAQIKQIVFSLQKKNLAEVEQAANEYLRQSNPERLADAHANGDYIFSLNFEVGDRLLPLSFMSSGQVELLALLTLLEGEEEKVICLDEPAINLHPTKQLELLQEIRNSSMQNQIILVTHSPYMVSTEQLRDIIRIDISGLCSVACFLPNEPDEKTLSKMQQFLTDPNLKSALFSKKVILVDGDEEEAALPIWFSKLAKRNILEEEDITLLNVNGDCNFENYAQILDNWKIPYFIICDKKAESKTNKFENNRYIINYDDFSELLEKECKSKYEEARKEFGDSKPRIARYVATECDPPKSISEIYEKLKGFLGQ